MLQATTIALTSRSARASESTPSRAFRRTAPLAHARENAREYIVETYGEAFFVLSGEDIGPMEATA